VIWIWAIGRAGNLDGGRVVVRYGTSTGRIMIRDEADGVHRHRGLRLSAEEKLRNGMRMHKKDLVLLLVEAVTGKRLKQWILHGNVDGLQKMRVKISAWLIVHAWTTWRLNECESFGFDSFLAPSFTLA